MGEEAAGDLGPGALGQLIDALAVSGTQLSKTATRELLRTLIKNIRLDGLQAKDGHLLVSIDTLAAAFGCRIKLQSLTFDEQGVEVDLYDVVLPDATALCLPELLQASVMNR